jgi:large repetitive protein
VTIAPVDGNNVINATEAAAGVPLSGSVSGLAANSTFQVTVTDNGVTKSYTATVNGTGTGWTAAIPASDATALANGTATVSAQVTDANGNQATATQTVTVAETGPTISIAPVDGNNVINAAEAAANVALSGTASGLAANSIFQVTVTDNGVTKSYTATVNAAGTGWTAAIPAADATALANGTATVSAQVTDANGNQATATQTVTVAETGPTIVITTPIAEDNIINKSEAAAGVTISGTVTAGSAAVNGQMATIMLVNSLNVVQDIYTTMVTGGDWSVIVTAAQAHALADGSYSIRANVSDAAGNAAATATQAIGVDTLPPTVTITNTSTTTNQATLTISGTVAAGEAAVGATVFVYDNGSATPLATATVGTGGAWSTSVTLSGSGTHSILAQDTDAAGNTGTSAAMVLTLSIAGFLEIENGATLSLGGGPSFAIDFAGTGGTLVLGSSPSFSGTIDAVSTATGSVTITGNGAVTTSTGDAIDLTASGGTLSSPASLGIVLSGAITGAFAGINAIQSAYGDIVIGTSARVIGLAGPGIVAEENSTGVGNILVDGTGDVTGTGNINSDGILAENLDSANSGTVVVSQTGNIVGGNDGIHAFTDGSGKVAVTTAASKNISGADAYGIAAESSGTGSIFVTTTTSDFVTSGSAGIFAYSQATSVPQVGGATTSSISVTAAGTINSGSTLTGSSSQPAGILAGYKGGTSNTPNAAVFGNVVVDNSADINAAGGDGIRAFNYGSGNVAVDDLTGATIVAPEGLGIEAASFGTGSVSISTVVGDAIDAGSCGLQAVNLATAIAVGAASSVKVVSYGTINSGTYLLSDGNQPQGISAGYNPGILGVSNTNVNGTVSIDNFANVTALAGWGIDAFNWGNGNVTLTDEAGTTVSGAQYGIAAYSLSTGSGSVTINVGGGATISAGALYGLSAIAASENNAGNITIMMSTGDVLNSGGVGIAAANQATSAPTTTQISITAVGTINSGFNTGNGEPGGIWAGYTPGGVQAVNANVAGNVIVDNFATINASSGVGIGLYNWGIGNLTAILESSSAIIAPAVGVNAYAQGGGNVSITNHGMITVASGVGISAGTGNGVANSVGGVVSIINSGTIVALGSVDSPVIQINNDSTQGAVFTNSGTVTAQQLTTSSSNLAVAAYTGSLTINNTGNISGNVGLATATFNNESGGVWNVGGSNWFGNNANAINNAGTINVVDVSYFTASGTLAFNNSGSVNVLADSYAFIGGSVSGTNGTFSIGDLSLLEFASSVAAGQTISFVDNSGLLTLDSPSTFDGTIANLTFGDAIDFQGISVARAVISGSTLTVTETNNQTLTYQIAGALAGATFNVVTPNQIQLVPATATTLTGPSGPLSFAPSTGQFYILSNETISGAGGVGFNVASTDSTPGDYLSVEINPASSILGLSGSFNGVSLTTSGANIGLFNSGTITSAGGSGITTNSGTGSTDLDDYGNVSGSATGIAAGTSGGGALNIVLPGNATTITGTSLYGILATSMLGVVDINTSSGDTINSGSVGIFALNQGSTVPQADNSSITISAYGTINSGSNPTGNGSEPGGIAAGYRGTTGTATPTTTVFGNVDINNDANIKAAAGWGIDAFTWGVGNISVSDDAGTMITATAAGATAAGFAQYGIVADNYESGDISIVADAGSTIDSGSVGINATNHATAISVAAETTVTVVALGAINSGVNAGNSGSAPAGIVAGFNPGSGGVFSTNVNGSVFINLGGSIIAAAGDGIRAYDYGVGDVTVDLGYGASIAATNSATAASGSNSPYGVGAFSFGPGDIVVTMSSGDAITSGSSGIEAIDQAATVAAAADALVTVTTTGTIDSGTIPTDNGSPPSGISAGFLGGTSDVPNLDVNGTVIVNNDANITAAAGAAIQAFNYGNGNVTVNDSSGTTVVGAEYGIAAYAESGGIGNVAVNVYSGANITGTSSYGILAYSTDAGNISVITSSSDTINSGSVGIDAVNEAATIAASTNSSIVVTAYGTINSGSGLTGTGSPPGGIVAGYLGGSTIPTIFPLTSLNGNVVVNNFANINAAAGDGIRAFNYGVGNVTVYDEVGSIILGGGNPTSGYENGISATNDGSGDTEVSTVAGVLIDSIDGGSGIVALNKAPAPSPGSTFSVPSTSFVAVLAYGTIESGNAVLTGSGDPSAGILAGYDPNNTDIANNNVQGDVSIDDYATILAPAGTDGIRGINYGTGTVTIIAEADATITAGRYGIGAFSYDGGDVSVTNYATVTGSTAAISATTTATGAVAIDNYGHLTGDVSSYNTTFSNEAAAGWSLNGISAFTGASNLVNYGAIQSNGTSEISGLSSITNSGTIEVQSGSLKLDVGISGTGTLTIDTGSILELESGVSPGQTVTFSTTTGMLKLDNAQSFHGTVSGLGTVDGTEANSDQLDLANINRNSASFSEQFNSAADTLTVSDGTNTAVIQLTGSYSSGSFNFVDDGNEIGGASGTSGTIIYDPPVPTLLSPPHPAANSTIAVMAGSAANDVFVFAPTSSGPAVERTIFDFVAGQDKIDVRQFSNISAEHLPIESQLGSDTLVTLDGHDSLLLKNVTAANLYASDFILHA